MYLGEAINVTTALIGCTELTVPSHCKNLEEHQLRASVKLRVNIDKSCGLFVWNPESFLLLLLVRPDALQSRYMMLTSSSA